jgi:hypothetical protein
MLRKALYGTLAASLLLLGAGTAPAQFASPIRLNVHGGAALPMGDFGSSDLTNPDAGLADLGFRLGAGLEFRAPFIPVGLRIDGAYDRMEREGLDAAWSVLSLTGNVVVQPMVSPLYFVGGIGLYRVDITGDDADPDAEADNNFGFNLGAGFQLPLPAFSPFIEARWNRIRLDADGETRNVDYLPIVLGIRF